MFCEHLCWKNWVLANKQNHLTMKGFYLAPLLILLWSNKGTFLLGKKVVHDRSEISWYNHAYYEHPVLTVFDYDRKNDVKAMNMSFKLKKDLPNAIILSFQLHKQSSNKDYLVFPLNYTGDICPMMAKDSPETQKLRQHGNMTGCPLKKGSYYLSNVVIEKRTPPPYIPVGSYMAEATTSISDKVKLLTTRGYFKIE